MDAYEKIKQSWRKHNRKRSGYTGKPVVSLLRDYSFETKRESFGVLELIPAQNGLLLVGRELLRGVTEAEARAVLEQAKCQQAH